jgi:hypothetical protein
MDLDSGCGSTRHRKARIFKKKEKKKRNEEIDVSKAGCIPGGIEASPGAWKL